MVESLALSRPEIGFTLRSDRRRSLALPAAGLKAHMLGRIDDLEAQGRKREEILSELVPATECRACDTGAVKGMLGG